MAADKIQKIIDLMGTTVRMEVRNSDGGTWVRYAEVKGVQAPVTDSDDTWVIVENYRTEDELVATRTLVGFTELADIRPVS